MLGKKSTSVGSPTGSGFLKLPHLVLSFNCNVALLKATHLKKVLLGEKGNFCVSLMRREIHK